MSPEAAELLRAEAAERGNTICGSAVSAQGMGQLVGSLEAVLAEQMEDLAVAIPHDVLHEQGDGIGAGGAFVNAVYRLGSLRDVRIDDDATFIDGRVPAFLKRQLESFMQRVERAASADDAEYAASMADDDFDWTALAKGRHFAVKNVQ